MATNTHTTTTVRVRLDLGELITKLRDLADTLETTQKPKTDDEGKPEASADPWCDGCGADYQMGEPHFGDCSAPECKHEAWDVHPNGITRHCSDCRATLPDLDPGKCRHCGAEPNEVHNPLFVHPERVTVTESSFTDFAGNRLARKVPGRGAGDFPCCAPEPANFTDGTKPYRNPATLDLPEGIHAAEAQHMLEVIADAQAGRTVPIVFGRKHPAAPLLVIPTQHEPTLAQVIAAENVANTYDLQPLRCPRCDDPWHPRTICPTCGCDNYRKNNPK